MREFGLFVATIPEEYGGLGLLRVHLRTDRGDDLARWMSLTGVINTHLMVAGFAAATAPTDHTRAIPSHSPPPSGVAGWH